MRRISQRLFEHIQFLGSVTVLYIQITVKEIVKGNSNKKPASLLRVGCPYKIQSVHVYIYIYTVIMLGWFNTYNLTSFDMILLGLFILFKSNLLMLISSPWIVLVKTVNIFLSLCDWVNYWNMFSMYLLCLENIASKYIHWFFIGDI